MQDPINLEHGSGFQALVVVLQIGERKGRGPYITRVLYLFDKDRERTDHLCCIALVVLARSYRK